TGTTRGSGGELDTAGGVAVFAVGHDVQWERPKSIASEIMHSQVHFDDLLAKTCNDDHDVDDCFFNERVVEIMIRRK
ncbi:hypothetical protein A2U01_0039169, partial [Trifolium medium]|nr:hypothetical protein [Trifolium medium]